MRRIVFLFAILSATIFQPTAAQEVQFSQFTRSLLSQNPSTTGYDMGENRHRFGTIYRSQWESSWQSDALQSALAVYEFRLCPENLVFGLNLRSDRANLAGFTYSSALISVAYHQQLGNVMLAVGANGGVLNYRIDHSGLTFNEQYDGAGFNPSLDNMEDIRYFSRFQPDLNAGILFYGAHFTTGIGFNHLNRPTFSFLSNDNRMGVRTTLHGSYMHQLTKGSNPPWVTVHALYHGSFPGEDNRQWVMISGGKIGYPFSRRNNVQVGIDARLTPHLERPVMLDAIIPFLIFDLNAWSIGISYDANVSKLKTTFTGGMEVSLGFLLKGNKKCPPPCPWEHGRH